MLFGEFVKDLCATVRCGVEKLEKLTDEVAQLRKKLGAPASTNGTAEDVKGDVDVKKSEEGGKPKRDRANVKAFNWRMEKETKLVDILTQVVCFEHAVLHSSCISARKR